jgi:PAS domain S-box-containing protein
MNRYSENLYKNNEIEILIVEDSPTQAEQLNHILEQNNYHVSVASNGKEALSLISKHKPTLVISDIIMPEMDGYQLCEHIKKDEKLKDIPVILVTSLSDPSDIIKGLNCGADHFITKPYDEKYLLARIRYIIANSAIGKGYDAGMGIEIQIGGQNHFITSDRLQVVHLLISTYEAAIHKKQELIRAQDELRALNEQLEEKVRDRTAALVDEIEERKRIEEALMKSEERYRTLVENIDLGITLINADYKIVMVNTAMVKLFKKPIEEIVGKYCFREFEKRDAVCSHCPGTISMAIGKPHSIDTEGIRDDGTRFNARLHAFPFFNTEGAATGFIEVAEDITKRERAEEELKKYREHLEEMVEIRTSELQKANEQLKKRSEELKDTNRELELVNRELALRRQEAEDAKVQAMSASKTKSDFLANISHELRTPLNSVIGFSEILQDGLYGELNEKQQEYVNDILSSGKHLLNLINDILDLSKVESGKMELELTTFPLLEVLEMSKVMFKGKALKHNITLSLEVEPDADIEIKADEQKLKQVLFNLIGNAMKFTPDGGSVSVQARFVRRSAFGDQRQEEIVKRSEVAERSSSPNAERDTDFVEISVEDTAIGIKQKDMDKLFKEFSQLETPYEKKYEGTGLGLALTKKFVELLGGRTWVKSEFGKGSKFSFVIPVRQR